MAFIYMADAKQKNTILLLLYIMASSDKVTQQEQDKLMENILKTITTLCTKVDSIGLRVQKLEENE